MATNCPQLLKPRACRSALCLPTAASKAVREISCNICEKMLHTLFKAESSSVCLSRRNLKLSETQPSTHLAAVRCQKLIWTRMMLTDNLHSGCTRMLMVRFSYHGNQDFNEGTGGAAERDPAAAWATAGR